MTRSIFIFAGEPSADMHGKELIEALKKQYPLAKIFGVAGPKMRSCGIECVLEMEKFQVMGFVDVFLALPRLIKNFFYLRRLLFKRKPDLVLFIDYPGFNLALASSLYKHKFPGKVCHYICPSVWAWGKKRILKMEKILDQLFVIFPFEKSLFNEKKLDVSFVGHPLAEKIQNCAARPLDVDKENRVVAIFPGSREKELARNFPTQLKVAKRLLKEHPELFFVVSISQPSFSPILEQIMREEIFPDRERMIFIDSSQNAALMKRAYMAIAKSGTNNLELALYGVPTVVTYGIGTLDLFIARNLLRINLPHYCIVNIVAGERVFPELIGPQLTEEALYRETKRFITSEEARDGCRKKCQEIEIILEKGKPAIEVANQIKI